MIDDSDFIFAQSLREKKCFCWCHTNTLGTILRRFPLLLWYTSTFSRYICQIFLYFVTPPHSADIFVKYFYTLLHLNVQPTYLSNIFELEWASLTHTIYLSRNLYRFNRIIHLHNNKKYLSNMVVFLYTPTQYSFNRYVCQILFPFFYTPTQ